jgi:SAM-dependent methyltransferase
MILDLGCGPNKHQGCTGIDHYQFEGVDIVRSLTRGLPFANSTVEGVIAQHILEHFDGEDLIFIVEEIWRVCKPDSRVYIEVPGLGSPNCGKDFTHKKKDWDEWSFQMWEKKDVPNKFERGVDDLGKVLEREYLIERGPMYGIKGEFEVQYQFNATTKNAHYELKVIK